jgi:translation elongation factor EF-Tu-like GTPase
MESQRTIPSFEAEVTFIPKSEGGRTTPPVLGLDYSYRPHIVLGDPNQRETITDGYSITEPYIGVAFRLIRGDLGFNEPIVAELVLIYPLPEYETTLVRGTTFTIREGGRIVGYGAITKSVTGFSNVHHQTP